MRRDGGFTLAEAVVATAAFGLLAAAGANSLRAVIRSYGSQYERQEVTREARDWVRKFHEDLTSAPLAIFTSSAVAVVRGAEAAIWQITSDGIFRNGQRFTAEGIRVLNGTFEAYEAGPPWVEEGSRLRRLEEEGDLDAAADPTLLERIRLIRVSARLIRGRQAASLDWSVALPGRIP